MAWAGLCRNTLEFGPVYAGMTMEANETVAETNERMPALLRARWMVAPWLDQRRDRVPVPSPVLAERMDVIRTESVAEW